MLLVIDVGNTNITVGVYNGAKLETSFRLTTVATRTSDEFGMDIAVLLDKNNIALKIFAVSSSPA